MSTTPALLGTTTALCLGLAASAHARTPIEMWIGVTGPAQELLTQFGQEFNEMQDDFEVNVAFRGQYPEQRAAAIAAFRAGNPPHIMQMFDAGTGDMFAAREAVVPVTEVYELAGLEFDPAIFLAPARSYYGDADGMLFSQPMNVSTAVMFYNRDILEAAGLDPSAPPATWPELIEASRQIVSSGAAPCGFTSTWISWIMLEQMSAIHDMPIGTQMNGRAGLDAELKFDNELITRIVATLADLQEDGSFTYGGRSNDAASMFIAGQCGMLMQSSGGHAAIERDLEADFGVAFLPHWPDLVDEPLNSIIGGASLWVFNAPDRSEDEFRGVAEFLAYLSSAEVMQRFAEGTGFLPATVESFEAMEGFFVQNPGRDVPVLQLLRGAPTENSGGYRFGRWTEIRDFFHEEVERALQGVTTPEAAVSAAIARGNTALRAFERTAATN
ncbi:MAG: extracellular solute-binding protein [Roseinatronobacter sp.]